MKDDRVPMQIIDTHVHYNLDSLFADWQAAWQKAQSEGVTGSVVIGTDLTTSQRAIEIAKTDQRLTAALAIHPGEYIELVQKHTPEGGGLSEEFCLSVISDFMINLELLIQEDELPHISAIGETGLDYYHMESLTAEQKESAKYLQKNSLEAHFQLAKKFSLPVLLHVRDSVEEAYADVLQSMDRAKFRGQFVLHCASGPTEYIQDALARGGYISFAGNVTYANAGHLRDLVKVVPADRILIETDAPFLPPIPHRGKPCDPWMIRLTGEYLEKELGVNLDQCLENSLTLFPKLKQSEK